MAKDFEIVLEIEGGKETHRTPVHRGEHFVVKIRQRVDDGGFMDSVYVVGCSMPNDELEEVVTQLSVHGPDDKKLYDNETTVHLPGDKRGLGPFKEKRQCVRCKKFEVPRDEDSALLPFFCGDCRRDYKVGL